MLMVLDKIDIALRTFIKALYPTKSHYLESPQASEQLKSPILTLWWRNLQNVRKAFGKKIDRSSGEIVCLAQKGNN